jgi:hypothetical protein
METNIEQLQTKLSPKMLEQLIDVAEDPTCKSEYFASGFAKALFYYSDVEFDEYACFNEVLCQLNDEKFRMKFRALYKPTGELI